MAFWSGILSEAATPPFPEPKALELGHEAGQGVQRFMKRLEESTPAHRNTVKVLFYGQSITEQAWTKLVEDDLRGRYPNVNFVIENRAIGGFASDLLVMTSEADLYPFYPDLLIFYDYGRNDRYEDMIRRMRERTTSEIVLQTDHLNSAKNLTEQTDPAKLTPQDWSSWFPNFWIPYVAHKYGTGMVQQRSLWKDYCQDYGIDPRSLTVDGTHLNDQGNFLMARLVSHYLVRRPQYDDPAVERQVRDYLPGKDIQWQGNQLRLPFSGNRIDVVAEPGAAGAADVMIDGLKPSQISELYVFDRATGFPGIGWPMLRRVEHRAPLVAETWTATLTDFSSDGRHFRFRVDGSVTGPDGEGNSDSTFVSKSGRVLIEPEYWNIAYSFALLQGPWARDNHKQAFVPPQKLQVAWHAVRHLTDIYTTPGIADPAVETLVTLAQGLANGPHTLVLTGKGGPVSLRALRIYTPPLAETPKTAGNAAVDASQVPAFAPPPRKN